MSTKLDVQNPYQKPGRLFDLPYVLQLGAGPTNCTIETLNILGSQPLTPISNKIFEIMNDIQSMLRYLYQTKNPCTLVAQTSGTGGNETMVINLTDPGETVVVACTGSWGIRVADMARRYKLNVIELVAGPGEVFSFEELEEVLIKNKPVVLFMTHGESSGGTLQPLDGLGDICHKHNCLLAVDAVVSVGVAPIFVDRWGIDAINGGSQKGLGAPPGMCLLSFSPRAYEKIVSKKHPPPQILDVQLLASVWACFNKQRGYVYTYSSNMLAAVRQALVHICEEGLQNVWKRHKESNELLVELSIKELNCTHFVKKIENRFAGVNCLVLPEDVKWRIVYQYCLEKYRAEISFGIGPTANKSIRVGLLALNATPETARYVINMLKDAFDYARNNVNAPTDIEFFDGR
ncbi:unnamed protein product [Brassicogethes aeneus]|uniref:Alanine--glyoxylate aminotransferase n=1 Tax=Brassicogethes aeneus TaxID=1431903 RepID=A0A9P0B5A9_BRAAE|nr:unnamed protein product [Brassicogethes aeneus]